MSLKCTRHEYEDYSEIKPMHLVTHVCSSALLPHTGDDGPGSDLSGLSSYPLTILTCDYLFHQPPESVYRPPDSHLHSLISVDQTLIVCLLSLPPSVSCLLASSSLSHSLPCLAASNVVGLINV